MASQWNDASEPLGTPPAPPAPPSMPPPGDGYPVTLDVRYPEPDELNRFMIFIKGLLIIPHSFLLVPLMIGAWVATWFAWWAILFTGRYPRSLFDFVVGVYQWQMRAAAYSSMLATDVYPPFSLGGRQLRGAAIVALVLGVLALIGLYVVLIALVATLGSDIENGGQFATPVRGGFR